MTDEALARRAAARYRVPGCTRDDLLQEAWLAILTAAPLYDPARHGARRAAYLTVCIRHHLCRLLARAGRTQMPPLAGDTPGRELAPDEQAIFNEQLRRPRRRYAGLYSPGE